MAPQWSLPVLLFSLCLFLVTDVSAQNITGVVRNFGDTCNPSLFGYNQALTYSDDCDSIMLACNPTTSTCVWKTCANVDYFKNWNTNLNPKVPQRCPGTQFCPDNGLACKNILPMGSFCEPQRDDECSPQTPPVGICMNSTCYTKTVGLGGGCGVDYQQYTYAYNDLVTVTQIIYRDNCTVGLTCDMVSNKCVPGAANGAQCTQDRDCASQSCTSNPSQSTGVCVQPPDTFNQLAPWEWGTIGAGVFAFVLLTLGLLFLLHRLQRRREQRNINAFFGAQDELKREMGFPDFDDARSSIVLTTPMANKRLSGFYKSSSANASRMSFQSDAGILVRPNSQFYNPQTGTTYAEEVKLQYQGRPNSSSSSLPGTSTAMSMNPNRRSQPHPLMQTTMRRDSDA